MIYIKKQPCPSCLENYKSKRISSFKHMSLKEPNVKQELRTSLLIEQGYVCAYCGSKIDETESIIEHIKCRQNYPELQLEYANLICSCRGGSNKRSSNPQYPLHCDAHKGADDIPISPLTENCQELFVYDENGEIHDNDNHDAKKTIEVLNLNNKILQNRRKAAIAAYKYLNESDVNWAEELQKIYDNQEHHFKEFCFVLEYYIRNYKLQHY